MRKLMLAASVAALCSGFARAATVTLDWDAVTTNADGSPLSDLAGYQVFYATYSLLGKTTAQVVASGTVTKPAFAGNVLTQAIGSLPDGTTLYFRLAAQDQSGNMSGLNVDGGGADVEVSTFTPPPLPPTAPGTPSLTVLSDTQIKLTWTDASGETSYRVERSLDGVNFSTAASSVAAGAVTYTDGGLTASTGYYYRVVAKNAVGETSSGVGGPATTNAAPVTPPPAPGGLSAVSASTFSVTVNWGNVAGENSYTVQRSLSQSGSYSTVGTTGVDVTTFVNGSGLSAGTTYYYRVLAVNGAGASTSTVASALTIPAAPGSPGAVAVSTGQITVTWSNVAGEDGYLIERSASLSSGYAQIAQVGPNVTSFPSGGLQAGTYYYYRVRAFNASGNSGYTAPVGAQTAGLSASGLGSAPAGLKEAYAYPNPAKGVDPVIRAMMGGVDSIEVTIYDQAGRVVNSGRSSYSLTVNGATAFEYAWMGHKAPGVYYAVIHGKHGDQVIRARAKFAVIR